MRNNFSYIIFSLLLGLASCKTATLGTNESKITSIPAGTTLVDVRSKEDFSKSPVKNAVNITLAEIENNLDFFRKQKQSVLFCNTGRQAGEAFEILKNNGIKNISNAKTWKNIYIMQTNYLNNLVFNEGPSTYIIKKQKKFFS